MKFSLAVANVAQELRRAELEIEDIADEDIDAKMDYVTELLRRITPVDTGYARSRWKNKKNLLLPGGEIINDTPYINRLNAGHSKQAPALFIERALLAAKLI